MHRSPVSYSTRSHVKMKLKRKSLSQKVSIKMKNGDDSNSSVLSDISTNNNNATYPSFLIKHESSCNDDTIAYEDGKKKKWEPVNWEQHLKNIRQMRKKLDAPVDTQGCERCMVEEYSEKEKRYHTLVSLILSSQTKDTVNYTVMEALRKEGLTPQNIVKISDEKLGKLIYPVSFWKNKVKYLKKTSKVLIDDYGCDIPDTVEDLVKLPGVGPKMAYLAMNCAWNKVVGIGVDVHVHRISNRLGWVKEQTKDPEKTRKELEDWLPQHLWKEVNWLIVGFGQQICKAQPKCNDCLNKDICPASQHKQTQIKSKKKNKSSQVTK